MNSTYLKLLMALMLFLMAHNLSARDFTYKGLVYTVLDENGFTCATKSGNKVNWKLVGGNVVSGDVEIPEVVNDGSHDYTVVEIGELGFYESYDLENIRIPSTIKKIGKMAFCWCRKLKAIDLPESLEEIDEEAFLDCRSLEEVVIPGNVTEISDKAFIFCDSLKRCIMQEGLKRIGEEAFAGCESLIINKLPDGLESIGLWAFGLCKNIEHMDIPDSVNELGYKAFCGCEKLKSIRLSKNIKSIYYSTFDQCVSLKSVEFPANLESIEDPETVHVSQDAHDPGRDEYDYGAFCSCESLRSIRLPESLSYIGIESFEYCKNLEAVVLPAGLKNIGEWAFYRCESLREIIYPVAYPRELPAEHTENFLFPDLPRRYGFDDTTYDTAVLKVGIGGLEKARERAPWKFFKHIEEFDFSGVEGIEAGFADSEADGVYRMDGIRVGECTDGLPSGLYIIREGGKASKVMVK